MQKQRIFTVVNIQSFSIFPLFQISEDSNTAQKATKSELFHEISAINNTAQLKHSNIIKTR